MRVFGTMRTCGTCGERECFPPSSAVDDGNAFTQINNHIVNHKVNRTNPNLNQKHSNSINIKKDARLYLDPVRECYEAYVIYSFYAYLTGFLEVGMVDWLICVDCDCY